VVVLPATVSVIWSGGSDSKCDLRSLVIASYSFFSQSYFFNNILASDLIVALLSLRLTIAGVTP